ncbi:MAG: helix-turn-helix transcriptional regulator [Clostridia bacterium]|nr:helix-turn-helix transcriptional regulator [Clostridia bacterium]
MDQVKIGKFIAELRRRNGLTQEALGEKIGVTNKTISRWENGNYMPDIEMLQLLAQEFKVSINELLSGERLSDEDFRQKADENVIAVSKASVFSFEERKVYFKKKWRKEHISLFVVLFFIFVASIILPFVFDKSSLVGLSPFIALIEYGYQNNKMMIYVEKNLYD